MNRIVKLGGLAALALAVAAPVAVAQARSDSTCRGNERHCTQQITGPNARPATRDPQAQAQRATPRAGAIARNGQRFERAANSRFKAPGRGQEYRIVDQHLVLVDSNTLKIVSVLGLLNTLLK